MEISEEVFDGRKKLCDERFDRDKERLEKLEKSMQALTDLVTKLAEITSSSVTNSQDHEKRLRDLEQRPVRRFDSLWGIVIGAVVGAAISALAKLLSL